MPSRAEAGSRPWITVLFFAIPIACLPMLMLAVQARSDTGPAQVSIEAQGVAPATTSPPRPLRVTPTLLPEFAATAELERNAALVPESRRELWGVNSDGQITGWADSQASMESNVFPIFGFDGRLLGIYVKGLGIVSRGQYDDPSFDSEQAAREKWGEEEYRKRLQLAQAGYEK